MKSTHHEARLTFFWGGLLWLAGSLLACFATFYVLQPKGSLGLQPLSVVPPVQHSREAEIVFDRVVVEPLPTPSLSGSPQHAGHQTVEAAQASPSPVRAPSLDLAQIERLVEQHQVKEALVELKKFVATHPRHAEAQMMLAMLHLLATEGEGAPEAVVALEKVLALDPSHELALVQLVELYEMTGTQKQGLTYLRGLQQQHPQNAVLNHSVGKALLAQGKSAEAVKYLEQAASVDPGGSHTVDLASAYSKNGQGDLALQSYTALIQQEEARIQSGTYAREPELGKERLTSAYLHKMFEYVRQHRLEEARELMEHKIKPQVGGNTALLNRYIEDYQDEFY